MAVLKKLPPAIPDADENDYAAIEYKNQQTAAINADVNGLPFTELDFTGSNLTSLAVRQHNQLQGLQGGALNEDYHLSAAQYILFASQLRLTITGSSGAIVAGTGATVVRVSTGLYTVTFLTARGSSDYSVISGANHTAGVVPFVLAPNTLSFQVKVVDLTGTVVDPTRLYITVT